MNIKTRLILIVALLGIVIVVLAVAFMQRGEIPTPATTPPPETKPSTTTDATATLDAATLPVNTLEPTLTPSPGPSPTPNPYTFITPSVSSSNSEELELEMRRWRGELNQRAQALYNCPVDCIVVYMFEQLAFKQVFPDAQMYAVVTNRDTTADTMELVTMVSRGDKDYRMPADFNQLMYDAGYEQLTPDTRDALAHAVIISGMPTEMILQPVTCDPGREIDIEVNRYRYTYEVNCQVDYEDIGDVIVRFEAFEDFFAYGSIGWGELQENGWSTLGTGFSVLEIAP